MDNSKMISSNNDKRTDLIGMKHGPPLTVPHNMRPESNLSRGFQPYRNSEERHPTPPHMYNPSPPPNSISGYGYHHPSSAQSSQMPPQSYRLEEPVYMERYGLLRPSSMPYPPPSTNIISHPRTPYYPASQYPPELISQSMRLTPSNSSTYTPNRYNQEEENAKENNMLRQREIEMFRERERYEREEAENREREEAFFREKRNHMRQSPISHPHPMSRPEINEDKNLMGSIIHGTPRDYARSLSPVSTSGPLNLATNVHMESTMTLKDEYNSKQSRQSNNSLMNGQLHHSSINYYRKEPDMNSSHRMQYQMTVSREKESQRPGPTESLENKSSNPSRPKLSSSYYMERENKNSNTFETRTLSMASVINSQINGIFAREKFPSNNSLDYLNSIVAKPEKLSDNQSKNELEHKKGFSSQENFPISTKISDSEKVHAIESLKNDSLSNKLPAFMYSESPITFRPEASEFSENYKMTDLSSARTQIQNHEIPSSNENDMCYSDDSKIVSTLDAREERLRKLRMIRDVADSEESEIDSDHEDTERLRILLTITKGPPPKTDLDPVKLKFLSKVDLITHSKKQAIELKKCIRRHQVLREKSASPIDMKQVKEPEVEYNLEHLNELAKRLCLEGDFQHKTEFLRSLGLAFVAPEQKEENENVDKAILKDKLRRNGSIRSNESSLTVQNSLLGKRDHPDFTNLKSETVKRPYLNQEESIHDTADRPFSEKKFASLPMRDYSQPLPPLQRKVSSFLKPPMKTVNIPVPPLIPTNQIIPPHVETNQDKGAIIAPKDPRVRQINKEFVQEFHNSVLQTTQMQLEKKNVSSSGVVEHTFFNKATEEDVAEKSDWYSYDRPIFRWPGIEAIMESYECHISEQTVEKKFLLESCHKLKVLNQEFNIEVECLQKRTEDLMQEKMYLDSEKRELQKRIESLKLFIEHFR